MFGHRAIQELRAKAASHEINIFEMLNKLVVDVSKERGLANVELLAEAVHVLPYFYGNRSPLADSSLLVYIRRESNADKPAQIKQRNLKRGKRENR